MSTSARDSGLRVRSARAISLAASASQVETLSSPVLASMRDLASNWACIMKRRASSTVGTPNTASTGCPATTTVIRTPKSICAKSASSASRLRATSASLAVGSESLTAITSRALCPSQPMISQPATQAAQARACRPPPGTGPATELGRVRKTPDAAPYARPMAAPVKTRR